MTTSLNLTPGTDPAYDPDPSCAVAHGTAEAPPVAARSMVLVFAGETARYMFEFGRELGFTSVLVEPDPALAEAARAWAGEVVSSPKEATADAGTDVVVTDHHRDELGTVLKDALEIPAVRWIGVVGNPRVRAPHLDLLAELGVDDAQVARVHRPIGLNIGSRTPAEIAVSTLAGLLADRSGKPGGFTFP
jgi:xanthine/CO dehydrogenase XdhC/CoxF family maturation factor